MSEWQRGPRHLRASLLFWGPHGSGKTSMLETLQRTLDPEQRHRLYAISAPDASTLSLDVLPVEEFRLGTRRVRLRLLASPGHPARGAARAALAREADAIVFVLDARRGAMDANRSSRDELRALIEAAGRDPDAVPLVYALNHLDHADSHTVPELREALDLDGAVVFDTHAVDGRGVTEAFGEAFHLLTRELARGHEIVGADPEGTRPEQVLPQPPRGTLVREGGQQALRIQVVPGPGDGPAAAFDAQRRLVEEYECIDDRNRQLEWRNRELMAVNRVARSILSALDVDNLLVVLLDATAELLDATHASCVIFDPASNGKLRTHVHGFGRDPLLGLAPEQARRYFELLRVSDGPIPGDRERNPELLETVRGVDHRVQRFVVQPIKTGNAEPVGWIGIFSTEDEPSLTTEGLLFLSSVSRMAALGLDKIGQLRGARRKAEEAEEEARRRTGELELTNAKLRALNRGLESRVSERTRTLEEANRRLRADRAGAVHAARLSGMGQLAASFAHEVNNPLAGLTANLDYMRESLDDLRARVASAGTEAADGLAAIREFEEVIEESTRSARRVTNLIASLKRFGGEEDLPEKVSVNAMVADVVTLLEERLQAHADLDLKLGSLPEISGDGRELGHAVLALVTNAIEALERAGRRGSIGVTTFRSGDKVVLQVRDDGPGIDERLLPRVFEPFVSSKEGEPNAGLGLHCALKAVRAQGGTIRLRSRPGDGTSVTVEMPVVAIGKREEAPEPGKVAR